MATSMNEEADARVFQIDNRNAHDADGLLDACCSMDVNESGGVKSHKHSANRGELPPAICCQAKREFVNSCVDGSWTQHCLGIPKIRNQYPRETEG